MLLTLFMPCAVMGNCYFSISSFDVTEAQLGTVIEVPVNAHFDARVDFWELVLTYPDGLIPVGYRGNEASMFEWIINENGDTVRTGSGISHNEDYTRLQAPRKSSCYWYPNGEEGGLEYYGEFKWEAGDYRPMFYLQLQVAEYFTGGTIKMATIPHATTDIRGGTVVENGDNGQTFNTQTNVSCSGAIYTAKPEIEFIDEGFGYVNIVVTGNGMVHVTILVDGEIVVMDSEMYCFEYTVTSEYDPVSIQVEATATDDGMYTSRTAVGYYELVPPEAPEAPIPVLNYEVLEDCVHVTVVGEGMVYVWSSDGDEMWGEGACELNLARTDEDRSVFLSYYCDGGQYYSRSRDGEMEILVPAYTPPYDFVENGIYYRIVSSDGQVNVACQRVGIPSYSGNVVIPGTVTHDGVTYTVTGIYDNAFAGCDGLLNVVIPATVTTIGQSAFNGCTGLTGITSMATTPPTAYSYTFNGSYGATLRVPIEALSAYETADYWKLFTTIQGYQGCAPGDVNGDGMLDIDDVSMLINMILGKN